MFIKYLLYSGMLPLYPQTDGFLRIISFLKLLEVLTGSSNASNFLRLLFPEMFANMIECCCSCLVGPSYSTLLRPCELQPAKILCAWDFLGNGVGCHFLIQGIFPTQELKLSLRSYCIAGSFFTAKLPGNPLRCFLT